MGGSENGNCPLLYVRKNVFTWGEGGSKKAKTPLRNIKMVLPSFAIPDLRQGCGKQWGQKSMKLELESYLLGQYFDYLTVQT